MDDVLEVALLLDSEEDGALYETLADVKEADRPERVKQWARLGHLVMSMARVAPGKEAMREYLADFTDTADRLADKIEGHVRMFDQKTIRSDGDLGERYVREQLFGAFGGNGDSFEVWSATGHQGDLVGRMARPDSAPLKVLVEVKDYTRDVPSGEVEKFRSDIKENPDMAAGIFVSLKTPVATVPGPVHMTVEDGRPVVYVAQEAPGQHLFVVAWAMLREFLHRDTRPRVPGGSEFTRLSARRIRGEVEVFLEEVSNDVSRIESITRSAKDIKFGADAIQAEASRLNAEVSIRARSLGRFLAAEADALEEGAAAEPLPVPWSESQWRAKFEEAGADWPKSHGANLTALLRWLTGIEGVSGEWQLKGIGISVNGIQRFSVTVLSNGLRFVFPGEVVKGAGLHCDWEKDKLGWLKFNRSASLNLDPEPILAALRWED